MPGPSSPSLLILPHWTSDFVCPTYRAAPWIYHSIHARIIHSLAHIFYARHTPPHRHSVRTRFNRRPDPRDELGAGLRRTGRVLMQCLQVIEYRVELRVAQLVLFEVRHGAQAVSNLEPFQEIRKRLVVQRRSESRLTARMATVAFLHEGRLAHCGLPRQLRGSPERRPSSRRAASAAEHGPGEEQRSDNVRCA